MSSIKIYPPNTLPAEGITDVQFQIWCQELEVYLEIEPKFRKFLSGGKYDRWIAAEQNEKRVIIPKTPDTTDMLDDIRRELRQFICIVAKYVHQDHYNPIVRHSTSLKWIYAKIREDHNIMQAGIHFFNIMDLQYDITEQTSCIGFYNQYRSMIMGNLAKKDEKIEWKNETLTEDEKLSPSHEDLILLNVLTLLHPKLPGFIRENYAHKMGKDKRLMDFKTEILSKAKQYIMEIDAPQAAAATADSDIQCNYINTPRNSRQQFRGQQRRPFNQQQKFRPTTSTNNQPSPYCRVCQLQGLQRHVFTSHYLGEPACPSLSQRDKQLLTSRISQQLSGINIEDDDNEIAREYGYGDDAADIQNQQVTNINTEYLQNGNIIDKKNNALHISSPSPTCNFIQPISTQVLTVQDKSNKDVNLDMDSGATVSYAKLSAVLSHGFKIKPNSQLSALADGKTKMPAIGEIDETFFRNTWSVRFHAIVCRDLHCEFVAGNNFIKENAVIQDFNAKTITVHKKYTVSETSKSLILPTLPNNMILQNNHLNVILPGQEIEIQVPHPEQTKLAVQPFFQNKQSKWPIPQICEVKNGIIQIQNSNREPIQVKNAARVQLRTVNDYIPENKPILVQSNSEENPTNIDNTGAIEVNTEDIDEDIVRYIHDIHSTYKDVFNEDLSLGYNHKFGKHIVKLNWANQTRPSASKIQNINYDHDTKVLLQEVCDDLTRKGVLGIPQENNIMIQYCSPSFLVRKQKAKNKPKSELTTNDVRLVVNFTNINDYLKNMPTSIVKPRDIFAQLGKWNYIIAMDLCSGFFQNHMNQQDSEWLGITTPFGGLRYLKRSGQGLISQSEELDEMLFKVLGNEMKEGKLARIADDLYVGGRSPRDTADNYKQILQKLQTANIKISAAKTKVFLKSIDVLGWKWNQGGFLSPSPHRVNALKNTKPDDIKTIKDMRSWMGLYKTLLPASKNLTLLLNSFDLEVADKESKEEFQWNRDLKEQFKKATLAVDDLQTLYLPHPQDTILIEVDAAKNPPGIGHTVYAVKDNKKMPVAFHSTKLDQNLVKWNACELEALAFANAIHNEYDLLKEAKNPIIISPDSKPVHDAIKKIKKGQYSSSPRMQSIINNVNRIPIIVQLASGKANQNASSDYQSRHPSDCTAAHCSVCNFVKEAADSVLLPTAINSMNPDKIMDNRKAWNNIQNGQKACKEAKYLLRTGKTPNKLTGKINSEIRRLCSIAKLDKNDLLIVPSKPNKYSSVTADLIVIPQTHLPALLWQTHNNLNHPSKAQLKAQFDKNFYSVGLSAALDKLYEDCFYCATQKKIPDTTIHQTKTETSSPGTHFHADVIKRQGQCIFTIRDHFSSLSAAKIVKNETHQELKKAIIETVIPLKLFGKCEIKVDNATGFIPLLQNKDPDLSKLKIEIINTDVFNKNANAVIDKACFELEQELKRIEPDGRAISNTTLQIAINTLNSRLRRKGQISAMEIHFNRDMHTGQNLNLDYSKIRQDQVADRMKQNEIHNSKVKKQENNPLPGDIVIVHKKQDKHKANDVFMVANRQDSNIELQKIIHPHSDQANIRQKQYLTSIDKVFVTKKFDFKPPAQSQQKQIVKKNVWNPIRTVDPNEEDGDFITPTDNNEIDTEANNYQAHIRPQNIEQVRPQIYDTLEREIQREREKASNNLKEINSSENITTKQVANDKLRSSSRSSNIAAKSKISAMYKKNNIPQTDGAITEPNSLTTSPTSVSKQVSFKPRHSSTMFNILDDYTEQDQSDNSSLDWDYTDNTLLRDPDDVFQDIDLDSSFMHPSLNLDLTSNTVLPNRVYTLENMLNTIQPSPAQLQKKGDADQ